MSWLASFLQQHQRYDEAKPLYERVLSIYEYTLEPEHPETNALRESYVTLIREIERQ